MITWWMDRPWWLRWALCLLPLLIVLVDVILTGSFWMPLGAIGIVLTFVNLFLSWGEILDRFLPRR